MVAGIFLQAEQGNFTLGKPMLFIYTFLILLAAFPLALTIWRIRRTNAIKKNGIHTDAIVTGIRTVQIKHTRIDMLTLEYKDRATGRAYTGKATVAHDKNRRGDRLTVAYLPAKPSVYAVTDTKKGYIAMLVFCILLFLFVLFAVYKINEMVRSGQM